MTKRVFLSSVFGTLGKVRQAVHDRLITLGYDVWWAEDHPQLRNLSNDIIRAVCLQGIESSDVYLGIYPDRYGSDPLELAFTELEYHYAVSIGLPRFLYVIRNRHFLTDDQKIKQQGFLNLIKDHELSSITPSRVSSLPELLTRISIDFEAFRRTPQSFNVPPWTAPSLERIRSSSIPIIVPHVPSDISINDAADHLRRVSNQSFQEAAVLGLAYIQKLFAEPRWHDHKFVKDLDDFLEAWNYVAAWAGISGALGQTNISKARIVLCQIQKDHPEKVYELAGGVASGLYAERQIRAARRWYELSRRFERHFKKLPWLLGPLELAEGNLEKAKSAFLEILNHPGLDEDNQGLHLGYYGFCLVREGNKRSGLRHLGEALNIKNLRGTTSTRIYRSLAESYLNIGDIDSAIQSCEYAVSIARGNALKGQLRKALALRRKVASKRAGNKFGQ
jgi:tetratricopeptide (TPR) repeat protein